MATSSTFGTSNQYVVYNITANVNSQSISNNTSTVVVTVRFWRTNTGYQTYGPGNVYCGINGTSYSQATTSNDKITNAGIDLFSRTVTINHNNDGSKTMWVSAYINIPTVVSSSDQGFNVTLPTIPRAATISSAPDFNDEANPAITYSNPAGSAVSSLQACISLTGSTDNVVYRDISKTGSSYTFNLTTSERNVLRSSITSASSRTVYFYVRTILGGNTSYSSLGRTLSIINANPSFTASQLSYQDTNSAITAITGNNQLIARNKSTLSCSFTAATPQKSATMSKYQTIFNGVTTDRSSAGTYSLGAVNSAQNLSLQVKAIDSRNNSTTIAKTVTILDWVSPIVNASAARVNNFENQTNLLANVQISSVNNLNSIQSLQYRTKKTSASVWSSWTNFANYEKTTINLDNLFAWDLQVVAKDEFGESIQDLLVPMGMPILFFDTKKLSIGINCFPTKSSSLEINGKNIFDMIWPVGSIYLSVSSINPSALFGGTWIAWGQGRVPVGVASSGTFNSVEKTGGDEAVTLTTSQIPAHTHGIPHTSTGASGSATWPIAAPGTGSTTTTSTGGGGSHSNLQPYITCYMFKRTA